MNARVVYPGAGASFPRSVPSRRAGGRHRRIENLSFLASRPVSASSARDSMRVTRGQRGVTPPRPSASRHGRSSRLQFGLCLDEYRRHACRRSLAPGIDRETSGKTNEMDRAREKPVGYSPRLCSSSPSSSPSSLLAESALHAIEASSHPPRLQPAARRRRRQARRSSDDEDAKTARAARERLMLLAATAMIPRSPRTSP